MPDHKLYTLQRFIFMTLDPVHIGTGGYRLGRVDNSIAREPGSNLPKIPGTSLSGAARSYAAMRYEKPGCAGQKDQCGQPTCPICYTFGSIRGAEGGNAGTVSLADARLLLFPVHSMAGPVWVTTKARLEEAKFGVTAPAVSREQFATTLPDWEKPLNLGWLLLDHHAGEVSVTAPKKEDGKNVEPSNWDEVAERLVLVEEGMFSQIVNSNLEVRTSVSIDPVTGAAKDGALFTYEAIPRAAWLWCDVVEDDYRHAFPNKERLEEWQHILEEESDAAKKLLRKWRLWKDSDGDKKLHQSAKKALEWVHDDLGRYENGVSWQASAGVVKAGLKLAQHLGIGGMGTRGFGRIKLMADWEVNHA